MMCMAFNLINKNKTIHMKTTKYFLIGIMAFFLTGYVVAQEKTQTTNQTSIPERKVPENISKRIERKSGKVNPGVGPKISKKIIRERRNEIKSIPASKQ